MVFIDIGTIISIVFIAVYFILFFTLLYVTLSRHCRSNEDGDQRNYKRIAFGLITLFPLLRGIGTILLVVANIQLLNDLTTRILVNSTAYYFLHLYTASTVLNFVPITFLLAGIIFLHTHVCWNENLFLARQNKRLQKGKKVKSFHPGTFKRIICCGLSPIYRYLLLDFLGFVLTMIGIVALIVQQYQPERYVYNNNNDYDNDSSFSSTTTSDGSYNGYDESNGSSNSPVIVYYGRTQSILIWNLLALIGNLIFFLINFLIFIISSIYWGFYGKFSNSAKKVLIHCTFSTLFLIPTTVWQILKFFAFNLENPQVWLELVLQYICESVALIILIILPFMLTKQGGDQDLNEQFDNSGPGTTPHHHDPPQQQQYHRDEYQIEEQRDVPSNYNYSAVEGREF